MARLQKTRPEAQLSLYTFLAFSLHALHLPAFTALFHRICFAS